MHKINIAIDGPAGAGKSTVARLVAGSLGFIYVDTGAMYRAVTWNMLRLGLTPDRAEEVVEATRRMSIELRPGKEGQQVIVSGQDVTDMIRSADINRHVSAVAAIPEVRHILVRMQQQMAAEKGVVMDGRDIGTHVLPNAEVKVFLTASARERALRRFKEMNDDSITLDQLEQDIRKRDRMDEERETSPLRQAEDAVLLDSTEMSREQVVESILEMCRTKVSGG